MSKHHKPKRPTYKQVFTALGTTFRPHENGSEGLDDSLIFSIENGLYIRTASFLPGDARDVLCAIPADDEYVITGLFPEIDNNRRNSNFYVGIYMPGIISLEQLRNELPINAPDNVAAASRNLGSLIMAAMYDEVMSGARTVMAISEHK